MRKPLLEKTLLAARKVAQNFYPVRIFSKMSGDEEVTNFWETRGLDVGDWMNLAILLMSEIFCQDFLTPLDDPDVCFSVEVSHLHYELGQNFVMKLKFIEFKVTNLCIDENERESNIV